MTALASRTRRIGKYARPDIEPRIRLTPDDDRILLEAYRHDVVDASTFYRILAHRTPNKVSRRLLRLYQTHHLEKLDKIEQIFIEGGGSLPTPYVLGSKGAERVQEVFKLPARPRRPNERAKQLSAPYILHDIELSRFLVSLMLSAERTEGVEFLYFDEMLRRYAPHILERDHLPRAVRAHVRYAGHSAIEGTIPDGLCMLRYPNKPEGRNRRALFIEIDRGHATIDPSDRYIKTPKFWSGSSILRKLLVYSAYFKRGNYQEEFGIPTFQVLTVTTTPERVKAMQRVWAKRLASEAEAVRFLFTDAKTISASGTNIIHVPPENAAERAHPLVPVNGEN